MRLKLIVAGFIGGALTTGLVVPRAQAPAGEARQPTVEQMRKAVGARAWAAHYAGYVHRRAAERVGLPASVITAVRDGRRPPEMTPDLAAVYDFCNELLTKKRVSEPTLQAARKVLGGDRGIVDLVGTLGAYQLVAMMMVVDEFSLPDGVEPELPN